MSEKPIKLTKAQREALQSVLPTFEVAMWGGKPMSKLPGDLTMRRLNALEDRGLVRSCYLAPFCALYSLTKAGVEALGPAATTSGEAP
jgi:hypothetical protein